MKQTTLTKTELETLMQLTKESRDSFASQTHESGGFLTETTQALWDKANEQHELLGKLRRMFTELLG
jgi:hypothetical protein